MRRAVATTHGHEVWWARTPGARALLRRIGERTDAVTYLGAATRTPIAAALGPAARRMVRLAPGVDAEAFAVRPGRAMTYGNGRTTEYGTGRAAPCGRRSTASASGTGSARGR